MNNDQIQSETQVSQTNFWRTIEDLVPMDKRNQFLGNLLTCLKQQKEGGSIVIGPNYEVSYSRTPVHTR